MEISYPVRVISLYTLMEEGQNMDRSNINTHVDVSHK